MKNQFYFPIDKTQNSLYVVPGGFDQKFSQGSVSLKKQPSSTNGLCVKVFWETDPLYSFSIFFPVLEEEDGIMQHASGYIHLDVLKF